MVRCQRNQKVEALPPQRADKPLTQRIRLRTPWGCFEHLESQVSYTLVKRLREDAQYESIPVILLTAKATQEDKVRGLDAGADDYVIKPFDSFELLARVRAMMRIKQMHDTLDEWNRSLTEKVKQQVDELQRVNRLKRYLSPQIAETILGEDENLFKSHRREITVVFLDLRGFTAFSDSAEPEEVMEVLRRYHAAMGQLIFDFGGTLERFAGDGIMIFFNDPIPCDDHTEKAVRMALAMQTKVEELRGEWLKRGYELDLGIGMAAGYATLGNIGFEGRMDYGAIGNVTNLAARLCGEYPIPHHTTARNYPIEFSSSRRLACPRP